MSKTLIIGGVAGGSSTAARLRRNDENAQITIFERGEYISYANCGLPYYLGGVIEDRDLLFVQTVEGFSERFNLDIRPKSEVISINTKENKVEVVNLKTKERYFETYDNLVLSPGAKPFKPPIDGIDKEGVFTLRNVEDTDTIKSYLDSRKPKNIVIVGAGYIGIEMADNMKRIASSVTVVEMADRVIPFFDFEMAVMIEQHLAFNGINVMLQEQVVAIKDAQDNANGKSYEVELKSGTILPADMIIMSVGVRPDTGFLAGSGIELHPNGSIAVNEYLQTNVPNVYAIGDAISCYHKVLDHELSIYLAGPASKQGRIVADNISNGITNKYQGTSGTAIIQVIDLIAGYTGISEDSLKRQNRPYLASITHGFDHAGYFPGALPMTIKLLYTPDEGKILGAQVVGLKGIDKRIDVVAAFIQKNATIYDLIDFDHAYAPPFSSTKDPITIAGLVADNIISGKMKATHWHQLTEEYMADKVLLDVRTLDEYQLGAIPNSLLIPIDELRKRLDEIPKDKPIIVYCKSGLRAYLALRVLVQSGFKEVSNLLGGYDTYQSAYRLAFNKDTFEEEDFEVEHSSNYPAKKKPIIDEDFTVSLKINACGLQCPGPIVKLKAGIDKIAKGEVLEIEATDPGFVNDLNSWCRVTGNELINITKADGKFIAHIRKAGARAIEQVANPQVTKESIAASNKSVSSASEIGQLASSSGTNKTLIVFSDDMDRALASFVIANGAAAMGREVTMFFTFWGLNVIKKINKPKIKRDFMGTMFGKMMPNDSTKLSLSKMNMLGIGSKMMRQRMTSKRVDSLEEMMKTALNNGVRFIACQMSMDVMGVVKEDLIAGVEVGGVATYLEEAEKSDTNLFI